MGEGGFLQPLQAGKPPSAPSGGLLPRNGQPLSPSVLCRDGPQSRRGQGWRLPRPLPGVQGAAALRRPYLAPPLCACPPGVSACPLSSSPKDASPAGFRLTLMASFYLLFKGCISDCRWWGWGFTYECAGT